VVCLVKSSVFCAIYLQAATCERTIDIYVKVDRCAYCLFHKFRMYNCAKHRTFELPTEFVSVSRFQTCYSQSIFSYCL